MLKISNLVLQTHERYKTKFLRSIRWFEFYKDNLTSFTQRVANFQHKSRNLFHNKPKNRAVTVKQSLAK